MVPTANEEATPTKVKYPGIRIATNGNQLVALYTEARLADAGVFYPITPSTEMGEMFELSFAQGQLNVFGGSKVAIETEGEHAAQGGAIAISLTGKRVVNFTSGQGIVYGLEQYYHAPAKFSTLILEVAARALTKHALNVHCGHDDVYAACDTGWIMLFAKDAQQASDHALIIRKVAELTLTPGINCQDGFLTSHLERVFKMPESDLIREFLGRPDDIIDTPTDAQRELFGPKRRRVPEMVDLKHPYLMGPVQNQEHYMQGIAARRNNFAEPILRFLEAAYREFGELTGRNYSLLTEYRTDDAETVFFAMGSACENIEASVDYLRDTHHEPVGVIHLNCLRPFPEAAVVKALAGKRNVIVLERTDEPLSGSNPLTRDLQSALMKAATNAGGPAYAGIPDVSINKLPRVFSGSYGLGSRDFRPEGILGAYEYVTGRNERRDGKTAAQGESFFYVGIRHPYAVISDERPSLLPEGAIAVRFHSVGGWGAITTGKNLGEIFGELANYISLRDFPEEAAAGESREVLSISANPKYGSEKKGAPTNYFLVVAPERIRVNCDLQHVNAVICCDPKAFTHTNPLLGMADGGALIWESSETDDLKVWERIPRGRREDIIKKKIRIFALAGFDIARESTDREDLQYRMQGNAFLGAFFKVSSFLNDRDIPDDEFLRIVEAQYKKKFGKLGAAVVASNMTVMKRGFENVREIAYGKIEAPDGSTFRGKVIKPVKEGGVWRFQKPDGAKSVQRNTLNSRSAYDREFRSGVGYNQPATPLMATGIMGASTGSDASKYVARTLKPIFYPNRCTQCMACITACPDTALPNTAQDVPTYLRTLFNEYISNEIVGSALKDAIPAMDAKLHEEMAAAVKKKKGEEKEAPPAFGDLVLKQVREYFKHNFMDDESSAKQVIKELGEILPHLPFGYAKANAIFSVIEKKKPGQGGIFGIFVSDLCKGCGECVIECGDHMALEMVPETPAINADHRSGMKFADMLPDTKQDYLGLFNADAPQDSKAAALQNHLMVRSTYDALVSGDGACAGCGEKTILRALATLSETYMRRLFHKKADRLQEKADLLQSTGLEKLNELEKSNPGAYEIFRRTVLHSVMGFGREDAEATRSAIEEGFRGSNADIVDALIAVLRQDAYNHKKLQTIEGREWNGMCAMAMTASTGCNTVYGSTHPSNPHPYPWMNSLFQDGTTIGWLVAESFIVNHARRSVLPERFTDSILDGFSTTPSEEYYWDYTHFSDSLMTDSEIQELPKVWAIGGDGAFGDIGFQNLSKVVGQNRPNVKILLLDTQVYSNTGGQNSDSSPMPGGFDMNQIGAGSQGKLTEKKGVAETMISGHGSPYVAQVSMANSANLYNAILEGLIYRGTAFFQCFTTCQPEHGVSDALSTRQAQLIRDARGMPEFVFNPSQGESYTQALSLKGNPAVKNDWYTKRIKATGESYRYTVVNWAATEARFRRHFYKTSGDEADDQIPLDDILWRVTQDDVVNRRFFDPAHRSYIPKVGVYTRVENPDGSFRTVGMSRQMVLFSIERRKSWRMLQSKAGIVNEDYAAQKKLLSDFDAGKIDKDAFFSSKIQELIDGIKKDLKG